MLAEVREIARTIASKSPLAVRGSKEMLLYSRDHTVSDGLKYIAAWNAGLLSTKDVQTAIAAQMTGDAVVFDD
jgi:enoyl-CoA hydratase